VSNNPYKEIKQVYDAKVAWGNAKTDEERKTQRDIADAARKKLKGYGYGDIADQVSADGADAAAVKQIMDKWAKMGKNPANDYLYSLGQSKGMSQQDIDKLISLDNQTGELSFGGKKIGTPDSVVDGVSYFADTTVLDNAFNDYINRSGTVRSNQSAVNQENEKLFAKYNQAYEDLQNENPFETEVGKSILAKYDLAGLQGRDNEVASGAGSNGGNIDSFAAANALRQQSALISQGHTAALEAHQQKLDHARALLSDMGVNIDRVFEQEETAKNNDVARKAEIAAVTGETPDEWSVSNNPYMNDDGTIKDEYKDIDFSVVMANAKAAGNTDAYNAAAVARYYKIMGNYGAYGQYDDGNYVVPGTKKTEAARQYDEDIAYQDRALVAENDRINAQIASAERIANGENATKLTLADKEAESALDLIEAQTKAEKEIIAANATEPTEPTVPTPVVAMDWDTFIGYFPNKDDGDSDVLDFLNSCLKPYYDNGWQIDEKTIENLIVGDDPLNSNSTTYDIDVSEARLICGVLGLDTSWLNKYTDRTGFNHRKGMKLSGKTESEAENGGE